jgi:hypothetical protein
MSSNEALALPNKINVAFDEIKEGNDVNDVLTWSGADWAPVQPISGTIVSYVPIQMVISNNIVNSRTYQCIVTRNGNLVNMSGVITLAYEDATNASVLVTLPINTINWIQGNNQVNGIATGPSGVFATVTQNGMANRIVIAITDSTNVGVRYIHVNYNINYLIEVQEGLPEVLTA